MPGVMKLPIAPTKITTMGTPTPRPSRMGFRTLSIVPTKGLQLVGREAEPLEVGDLVDQPGIGAPSPLGHAGARVPGEAAYVHLVDDRLGKGTAKRLVSLPVVARDVRHQALHCDGRVVAGGRGGLAVIAARHRHARAPAEPRVAARRSRSLAQHGMWWPRSSWSFLLSPSLRWRQPLSSAWFVSAMD